MRPIACGELIEVLLARDRVDRGRVHDQKRRGFVLVKEARVGFVQPRKVRALDALLKIDAAARDALQQHIDRGLQVDDEIRFRRVNIKLRLHLLVERVLGFIERHAREQPVFFKQIIRHAHRRKQVLLRKRCELLRTLEEKSELRGKRAATRVSVEALQKRVLRRLLQYQFRRQARRQALRKARLADPDRPLDHDETMVSARFS